MAIKVERVRCQNCGEVLAYCNQEETIFCDVCEDTVFTPYYSPGLNEVIEDDFYGYSVSPIFL